MGQLQDASDAVVVARVLGGDIEAFGILVDRYQNMFAAYANFMTGDVDAAADVIQESLVRAYKSLKRCRNPNQFKGWLFRIVSNQCKTYLKRRKRRQMESLDRVSSGATAPGDPHADVETAELKRQVHAALDRLPATQQEVLILRHMNGLSVSEIGEMLSISVSAVKMRLMRGREALRAEFEGVDL